MKKSMMILTLMALSSICFCGLRKGQSEENCNALRLSNIEALSKPVPVIGCVEGRGSCRFSTVGEDGNNIILVLDGYRPM